MNTHLSKHERRKLRREKEGAQMSKKRAGKKLLKYLLYLILIVLVLWIGYRIIKQERIPPPGIRVPIQGREHINAGAKHDAYISPIPVSGPHSGTGGWGFSEKSIPAENYIHNLEHGGIVILYKPDISQENIDKIEKYANKKWKVLATSSESIPSPIGIAAWGWYQLFDTFDKESMNAFYKAHLNRAPENVE